MIPPISTSLFQPERDAAPAPLCPRCQRPFRDGMEAQCSTCSLFRGAPNVLAAAAATEQDALDGRVRQVLDDAAKRSCQDRVLALGDAVRRSVAVVNVSGSFARQLFASDRSLYATYGRLTAAKARLPAAPENDSRRRGVDALLFGGHADEICFAALSLDGRGLTSYGPVTLVLSDVAIAARASVLEENSFFFVEHHQLRPGLPFPAGYRASWARRHLVAMAKLGARVTPTTTDADFPSLVLAQGRSRDQDDFIEVYIFGSFDCRAVERIVLPKKPAKDDRTDMKLLRQSALRQGILVEEA